MWDPKAEVGQAAERIRNALTRLGLCYRTKDGELLEVCYRRLGVVGDQYGVLEVDVQRLPPRVSVDRLTAEPTLHHLTAVVGKPVHKLNTTGLTYCIELHGHARGHLPRCVPLDLSVRPPGEFMIPIGQGPRKAEWRSLLETSHILVGGESRSGKSTWLHAALVALLSAYDPAALRLALVAPQGVEFTPYEGLPHLVKPVAVTPEAGSALTAWLIAEMDRRRDLFAGVFARDLTAYNARAAGSQAARLPLLLVVIDEVSDIALQCGVRSTFYRNLIRLSSKGAAFGIVLILATQNPKAEVLNTLIRGNLSTRIAFRVASPEHSRTILGCNGAQSLPRTVRGRLVARLEHSLVHLQGFLVPDEDVLALARRWVGQGGPSLSSLERELVAYACQDLDGSFPVARLYSRFRGSISYRQLVKLARRWEANGWLSAPASAAQARQVADPLRRLVQAAEDDARPALDGGSPRPLAAR